METISRDSGDFRLVVRKALDAFLQMRESNRYIGGMFSWIDGLSTAPLRLALAAGPLLAAASPPAAQVPLRPAK